MSPLPAADDAGERGVSILQRAQDARRGRVYRMPAGESDSEDEDSDAGDDDAHARVARAIFRIGGGSDPLEASTQEMSQDMAGSEPEPSQELPLVAEEEMSDVVMETSRPRTPIRAPPPEPARMPAPPSPVSPRRPRRKDPSKPTKPEGDPAPAPATDLPRMRSVRFDEPAPRAPKRPREEAPLADMRNRPEADHPHPQSQSQSQSQSSEASEPLPEPLAKRRRVEAWRAEISDALDTDAQARRGVQRAQETAYVAPPLPTPVEEVRRAAQPRTALLRPERAQSRLRMRRSAPSLARFRVLLHSPRILYPRPLKQRETGGRRKALLLRPRMQGKIQGTACKPVARARSCLQCLRCLCLSKRRGALSSSRTGFPRRCLRGGKWGKPKMKTHKLGARPAASSVPAKSRIPICTRTGRSQ
ncbi:hypothetical protein BC834DRAFT_281424 [Gloeopeniophorella convolvens]|nr:hypothetical protein BC834DRAFT_281424 [Gloeopeniophorella convolvens]